MSFSHEKQFLDLVKDTKAYLSQLDSSFFVDLSSDEMAFFTEEIKEVSPKLRKRDEKKEASSKTEKQALPAPAPQPSALQRQIERPSKIAEPMRPHPIVSPTTPIKIKSSGLSKPEKKIEEPVSNQTFTILEKPQKAELGCGDIKDIMKEISPNYPLIDIIPSDKKAKDVSQIWKLKKRAAEITILSFRESPQQLFFIKNLAQAIDIIYLPTKIISAIDIEQENQWNLFFSQADLKMIIACDYSILSFPNLAKHYKEIPAHRQHFLSDIPLFMLPDISLYLKDPMLKKSLWASLKNKILLLVDR